MKIEFTVIDKKTNLYPDMFEISKHEDWANDLLYLGMECFVISEDGVLMTVDQCGNVNKCPEDRFEIKLNEVE